MHHLILLIFFTLALYRNVTINYLILTLVCEDVIYWKLTHEREVSRYIRTECLNVPIVISYPDFLGKITVTPVNVDQQTEVPPGFEPRSPDSKSGVLTTTPWNQLLYVAR
ncbi:hypothetical protein GUJ93_ZPchr0001g31038 [Zizania palustris]|uniref:Uncharacterized protein n=1 Tax=Zizania palustris TaxID=103762 RepID=A0A8J5SC70_ZIZPA|nr:hypothetical protein GUJ93_ZPchr0001g31038 [Zizania palustris]